MKINTTYFTLKERHMYGSSRVGVRNGDLDVLPLPDKTVIFPYSTVISEMLVDIRVAQDYSPFGVTLDGRNFVVSEGYRYGYNGMEADDEVKGEGNSYTTEFRQYDPRLGRWLSLDPKMVKFPSESPFVAFHNNPVFYTDPHGDDPPEDLVKIFGDAFKAAWHDSFRTVGKKILSGETGGVLIKITTTETINGETVSKITYQVHNYIITKQETVTLNYGNLPKDAEIIGDFHTHPWDEKEIKEIKRFAPDFDPSATPFSDGDYTDAASQIRKGNITNGDVSFVVTEKAIYGIVIDNAELAKEFFGKTAQLVYNYQIKAMNGEVKPKEGESFGEYLWKGLLAIKDNYESENKSSGITLVKVDVENQ